MSMDDVLRKLRPTQELQGRLSEAVQELEDRTRSSIERTGLPLQTMLVGSVAKSTYVGEPDIDLFVLFPTDTERSDLEKFGLQIGEEVLHGEVHYAEHPYTHGKFHGFEVDLVPCYRILDTTHLRSAVDRTPFHTRYVLEKLTDEKRDQVRLLKQFMKGIGVYGAEARVQGFSGYLTELLIIRYGDLASLICSAKGWRPGIIMDAEGGLKGGGEPPLTFADPVDQKRNVASALSLDRLSLFIHACQEYSVAPDDRFFFPRERPVWEIDEIERCLQTRGTSPLVVVLERPDLVDDNLYPQVQRSMYGLRKMLESYDFNVLDQCYAVGKDVRMAFELEHEPLPKGKLHQGPPAWTVNAREFVEKWRDRGLSQPFLCEGRWQVYVEREFRGAVELLLSKGKEASLGNNFRELDGIRCYSGKKAYLAGNRPVLTKMLDKRENWRV
ncbi:MAG: CCA tRNA nucleotidyltransferase [Methanomassiliicoccales archaeon]|nr:CCA tRNA nucleotidyltransferase [Methanomassiliicoccales archaeon]